MAIAAQQPMTVNSSRLSGQNLLLAGVVIGGALVVGYLFFFYDPTAPAAAQTASRLSLDDIPFDGRQAYEYLREICALGSRTSDTRGMHAQQKMLAEHFKKLGAKVRYQKFRIRHPSTGEPVAMANLIVEWHPERRERILL